MAMTISIHVAVVTGGQGVDAGEGKDAVNVN